MKDKIHICICIGREDYAKEGLPVDFKEKLIDNVLLAKWKKKDMNNFVVLGV